MPLTPNVDYHYTRYRDINWRGEEFEIRCVGKHPGISPGFPMITERSGNAHLDPGDVPFFHKDPTPEDFEPDFEPTDEFKLRLEKSETKGP